MLPSGSTHSRRPARWEILAASTGLILALGGHAFADSPSAPTPASTALSAPPAAETPAPARKHKAKSLPTPVATADEAETPAPSATVTAAGQDDQSSMSLQNLANQDVKVTSSNSVVTSSAKKGETLRRATSAIYVITQDDIRRSGARELPDLLAMVPGVQVARLSAGEWAISARGFNATYNDKMLVLVDGRSVYDPVLGGVYWNEQDLMLEDIDHIEVIRGPGGTLWGSNAVNGVVNIITKDSKVTQGLYLSGIAGEPIYPSGVTNVYGVDGQGDLRYGGKLGDDLYYRVYGKYTNQNPNQDPATLQGHDAHDDWWDMRAGFRVDLHEETDQLTLESEGQKGYFNYMRGSIPTDPVPDYFNPNTFEFPWTEYNTTVDQNAHVLGRWTHRFEDGSDLQLLSYYDYVNRTTTMDSRITNVGTFDIEAQHRFTLGGWNEITWGGGWRNISDQFYNPVNFIYLPNNQNINIYNGFLQDQLTLVDDRLYLTAGSKLENNPYTGDEWSPSGRILWTPDRNNSFWGAVSKAERTPPQSAESLNLFFSGIPVTFYAPDGPFYFGLVPNTQLKSETLISYELGYRTTPTRELSLDISGYFNHYENLISIDPIGNFNPDGIPNFGPSTGFGPVTPLGGTYMQVLQLQNTGQGDLYGVELSAKWDPLDNLHFAAAYTYENIDDNLKASLNRELGAAPPRNMANGRVTWEAVKGVELNTALYYTDATYVYDPDPNQETKVEAYTRWDAGLRWKTTDDLELSVWGMDLEGAHSESILSYGILSTQVEPSIYGQLTVRY